MTLEQLQERVKIKRGKGTYAYIVTIKFYHREYTTKFCFSSLCKRIKNKKLKPKEKDNGYTLKEAYQKLYDDCCWMNNIGRLTKYEVDYFTGQ